MTSFDHLISGLEPSLKLLLVITIKLVKFVQLQLQLSHMPCTYYSIELLVDLEIFVFVNFYSEASYLALTIDNNTTDVS